MKRRFPRVRGAGPLHAAQARNGACPPMALRVLAAPMMVATMWATALATALANCVRR